MLVGPQSPLRLWLNAKTTIRKKVSDYVFYLSFDMLTMHIMLLIFDMQSFIPARPVQLS